MEPEALQGDCAPCQRLSASPSFGRLWFWSRSTWVWPWPRPEFRASRPLVGLRTVKRLKIFTDKFGQQASTFALLGGLWVFLGLLGAGAIIHFLAPDRVRLAFGFPFPLAAVGAPLLAGAAIFLIYRGMWQRLKTKKAAHASLGLTATLFFWLTLYAGLASYASGRHRRTGPGLAFASGAAGFGALLAIAGRGPGPVAFFRRHHDRCLACVAA